MMQRKRKRTVEEVSATPEAKATRLAVKLAGGAVAVGSMVHPPRCEDAVRKWTEDPTRMSPQDCRALSRAGNFQVPVSQMRPDVFGSLTVQELGYLPDAYPARQSPSA